MKFICTNKGRFSVHNNGVFIEFVNGELETDNVVWLDVLKNVQGVQVVEGGTDESSPLIEEVIAEKRKPGRPRKDKQ